MSLKFAILTSLTEREGSGIELARRFDRSIGYFWPATHQQIYRELDRLGAADLIRELPQEGPPRRGQPKRFQVTDEGRALLDQWVGDVDDPEPMKSTLAVRVRAAAATGRVHDVRAALVRHRERRQENLRGYREIEQRDFTLDGGGGGTAGSDAAGADAAGFDAAQRILQHRILTLGIEVERAWVSWCDETLAALDRLDGAKGPSAHGVAPGVDDEPRHP